MSIPLTNNSTTKQRIVTVLIKPYVIIAMLLVANISLALGYVFINVGIRPDFVIPMRIETIIAVAIVSVAVGYATIIFQTVTNSKILTPGILGFESIYTFVQTAIVFLLGSGAYLLTAFPNFLISVGIMIVLTLAIYVPLFFKNSNGIYFVLLVGVIVSSLFVSLTTYMQYLINPDEFAFLQGRMFASFEFPNMFLVLVSSILIGICILAIPRPKQLDVLSLDKNTSIGLGLSHRALSIRILIIVAVLVSVSTVTVGPMMFLGILVANLTYLIMQTYKHIYLIPACILTTSLTILIAQFFSLHIYNLGVSISVIINFVGGILFILLLLRKKKQSH